MIELLIALIYANSDAVLAPNGFYAARTPNGLWGVNERADRFTPSEPDGIVYEPDMTETEAKLICLLHNNGIASGWANVLPYIEMLKESTLLSKDLNGSKPIKSTRNSE